MVEGVPVVRGTVEQSSGDIQLDRVPIVTPNCDVVVASLSIQVGEAFVYYYNVVFAVTFLDTSCGSC
jgi:hypothetical protein